MPVEDLRLLLSQAVTQGEPSVGDGPAAVFARARRRRRHRRIAVISGVAGFVAVVGLTAGPLLPTRPAQVDDPALATLALATEWPQGRADSPRLALVKSLLPADLTVSDASEAGPDPLIRGQMVVTDAVGQTVITYVVLDEADWSYRLCSGEQRSCEKQYRYPGNRIASCVNDQNSAHLLVTVCAMNAFPVRGENPGPVTRPTPVLTVDQLKAIAADPHWSMQ